MDNVLQVECTAVTTVQAQWDLSHLHRCSTAAAGPLRAHTNQHTVLPKDGCCLVVRATS